MENKGNWKQEIGDGESGFFHHAYFLEGDRVRLLLELKRFLKDELGIECHGNPDFREYGFERFFIQDAERLREEESRRAFSKGGKKIFCIAFHSMTREAGNALLKTLEEPSESSVFFFIVPSREVLLPTFRSRLRFLSGGQPETAEEGTLSGQAFLEASKKDRLEMIAPIVSEKDRQKAIVFIDRLENFLSEKAAHANVNKNTAVAFRELWKTRDYLRDTSSSVKLLLEHLALVLPKW